MCRGTGLGGGSPWRRRSPPLCRAINNLAIDGDTGGEGRQELHEGRFLLSTERLFVEEEPDGKEVVAG